MTVQLLFEPSGRPLNEHNYYLYEKDNLCVVCGAEDSYIRKNIIPREYRKYVCTVELFCTFSKVKYTDIAKFAGHLPHRYGNSRAIWDHTVLPATRQR